MKELLLIGPMPRRNDPTLTGGIIVLFEDLRQHLDKQSLSYHVIDTNKNNYRSKFLALLSIWWQILFYGFQCRIFSLHGTANDYTFIAPLCVAWGKLLKKKVSLRKFAGNFDTILQSLPWILRAITQWALKNSDVNFFETHYLTQKLSSYNDQTYWFPNVRSRPAIKRTKPFEKKFLFIGSVTEEKGIKDLLEASLLLQDTSTIDIYGPLYPDMAEIDFTRFHVTYHGPLASCDILDVMRDHDVLILPSYREGYPGVIIEALSLGLPIITTPLEGICEMVDTQCAIFVPPHAPQKIAEAIAHFTEESFHQYAQHALECFEPFDSTIQTEKFLQTVGIKGVTQC